jgi:hypothetical protein
VTLQQIVALLASLVASALTGGIFSALLVNRRLAPKSSAEARQITAAAMDQDWQRFEREINRLVERLTQAEDRASGAEQRARECEEREGALKARVFALEAYQAQEGQMRQDAAMIVAAERAERRT